MLKEDRLEKRRITYHSETVEQKERRRIHNRNSYKRHKVKRSLIAKLKRQEPGEAEKQYSHKRDYYRANPKKYLLMLAKKRCKNTGIKFDLCESDFEIPEYCPVFLSKLEPVFSTFNERNNVPTLDRVDNNKGYVRGNVKVLSFRANKNKSDMRIEDIERLYNYIKERVNNEGA